MVRGKYRIDAFIAAGSMSTVYAATHRNGSRVALKILLKDLARDASFAERFRREGYFGNSIIHPGIVRAIDDDMTDDGCSFLVFELLEGETLEQKRERLGGKLPLTEVLNVGDTLLDILAAAHDHQIIHRDLKPDNVYITRKAEVKLFDFGVARFNDGKSSSDMTGVGIVLGTVAYMSPEQASGKREDVDARSDIWSIGAMLFTCITGEGVHAGGDANTKSIAVARTKARSLREVAPQVPRVVANVIDRALSFDKAERFADAKSMRESLGWARRSLTGEGDDEPENSEPLTKRAAEHEDEPTKIGRANAQAQALLAASELAATSSAIGEDEETEKRAKISQKAMSLLGRMPEIKRGLPEVVRKLGPAAAPAPLPMSEGVITSAPPVTQREKPPEMPLSEGPTFSLRNEPVFSLKESREKKDPKDPIESASKPYDLPFVAAPMTERLPGVPARPGSDPNTPKMPPKPADPGEIFRAALAQGGGLAPLTGTSPMPDETPLPAAMPRQPVPLVFGGPPMAFSPAPQSATRERPLQLPTHPPPPFEDDPIAAAEFRVASVNQRPGNLLSQIAPEPKKSSLRFFIPIFIGLIAMGGTYFGVTRLRLRAATAAHAPAPPAVSASATPATSSSLDAGASDASAVIQALPLASVSASAVPASSVPPIIKKKKPKPKPPPAPAPTDPDPGLPATLPVSTD